MITLADTIKRHKATLRRNVRAELTRLAPEWRASLAAKARAHLVQQSAWERARSVLFYAPLPEELDIWPMLSLALTAGKQVALPRFVPKTRGYIACRIEDPEADLVTGQFGIREPTERCLIVPMLRLDFILVPGVAFDLQGHRLGRGRGFYDSLLAGARGRSCGVAFDEQIVKEVPVEPHDVQLSCLVTPTRWVEP